MKKRSNLFRGFAVLFLALLVLTMIVSIAAGQHQNQVNELLEISGSDEDWWKLLGNALSILTTVIFLAAFVLFFVTSQIEGKSGAAAKGFEVTADIVALLLTVAGIVLFALSGGMENMAALALLAAAVVFELAAILFTAKLSKFFWVKLVAFPAAGCLGAAAGLILGDQIGEGGKAVWMALGCVALLMGAVLYVVIGCFGRGKAPQKQAKTGVVRSIAFAASALAVLAVVMIPTFVLANRDETPSNKDDTPPAERTYEDDDRVAKITFKEDGSYTFTISKPKVEESGTWTYEDGVLTVTREDPKESFTAEGDPLVLCYKTGEDESREANFSIPADDLKELTGNGGETPASPNPSPSASPSAAPTESPAPEGSAAPTGSPDPEDSPEPSTEPSAPPVSGEGDAFTSGGETEASIVFYPYDEDAASGMYMFTMSGESGEIEEFGDWTCEGDLLTVTREDGTEFTAEKQLVDGEEVFALQYESAQDGLPAEFVIPAEKLAKLAGNGGEDEPAPSSTPGGEDPTGESLTFASEDGKASITFFQNGEYTFEMPHVEETGTWTYADGLLTVTREDGTEFTAEGDPLAFTYESAKNKRMSADFSIPAADLETLTGNGGEDPGPSNTPGGEDDPAEKAVSFESTDDKEAAITFYPYDAEGKGTFVFAMDGEEDTGTWTLEEGKLSLANAEQTISVDKDPLEFTYSAINGMSARFSIEPAELLPLTKNGSGDGGLGPISGLNGNV